MLAVFVDAKNGNIDLVANIDQLIRMVNTLDPRHFRDVNQTFDARLKFHKCTVVHHVDNLALVDGVDWVFLLDVVPWVRQQLLEAQTNLSFFAVDGKHHDVDFLIHRHHFRWLGDACVRHVGNVQQTVDAAKINKRTKVSDVLDHTFADLANFQFGHQFLLSVGTLFLD